MAKKLKVENGTVQYLFKNFDGTYTLSAIPEDAIDVNSLSEDSGVEGFELTDGRFMYATVESKGKRSIEDKSEI